MIDGARPLPSDPQTTDQEPAHWKHERLTCSVRTPLDYTALWVSHQEKRHGLHFKFMSNFLFNYLT